MALMLLLLYLQNLKVSSKPRTLSTRSAFRMNMLN